MMVTSVDAPKNCRHIHCYVLFYLMIPILTILLSAILLPRATFAFTPSPSTSIFRIYPTPVSIRSKTSATALSSDNNGSVPTVKLSFPSADATVSLGIREWPQKYHSVSWSESVSEGQKLTRYILSGKGRLLIQYSHPTDGQMEWREKERVYPGTLVEVHGEASLFWELDERNTAAEGGEQGMIVLTPTYEEGGKLALVAGFLVVFCAGLLLGSGG